MSGSDAPTDLIQIRALRAIGCHGVLEEERQRAQPFEADLELEVDLRRAGQTDALADTVDYGAVTAAVVAVIEGDHSDLLEHLATRIAQAAIRAAEAADGPSVTAITVSLRKLRPPVPADLESAGVRIRRRRQELV